MTTAEQRNHAKRFLAKAQEYLAAAEDSLDLERFTVAAGDAIHAGICAKDAIVTIRTGATSKGRDHASAAKAEPLVRRATALVDLAAEVVQLGR